MSISNSYFSKARVEAFSDGIFAIIVTLLVLEIKVPEIHDVDSMDELGRALIHLLPKFVSWIISFMILCVFWVNHHRIFEQLTTITHSVFWFNANLMLWCSFIPFPTALMGDYINNPISLIAFGIVLALAALAFTLMRWKIINESEILKDSVDRIYFKRTTKRSLIFGPVLYTCGALSSLIHPYLAFSIYLFIPIYFIFYNSSQNIVSK